MLSFVNIVDISENLIAGVSGVFNQAVDIYWEYPQYMLFMLSSLFIHVVDVLTQINQTIYPPPPTPHPPPHALLIRWVVFFLQKSMWQV